MRIVKIVKYAATCIAPLLAMALVGCETPPTALEQSFGSSVRHMIQMQTARADKKGTGLDGQKAEAMLEAYRTDVAKPENVERDIINIELGK